MFTKFCVFYIYLLKSFPYGAVIKNPPANTEDIRDVGLNPGPGLESPGIGNGNPLQYSCLENSID